MGHLSSSLRTLVDNLKASNHDFPLLRQSKYLSTTKEVGSYESDPEKIELAKDKIFFPYKFATSIRKCKETKRLPFLDDDAWRLSNGKPSITYSQHQHALSSWNTFGYSDLYDYMQIYCLIDTVRIIFIQFIFPLYFHL